MMRMSQKRYRRPHIRLILLVALVLGCLAVGYGAWRYTLRDCVFDVLPTHVRANAKVTEFGVDSSALWGGSSSAWCMTYSGTSSPVPKGWTTSDSDDLVDTAKSIEALLHMKLPLGGNARLLRGGTTSEHWYMIIREGNSQLYILRVVF